MRTCIVVALVCFCLAGCVGMSAATTALRGQDIAMAVSKLGYPDDKQEMFGNTVYRWKTGNQYGGWFCNLNLVADSRGKIISGSWSGNGGCSSLAERLD